jgi:hypothetical protein
MPCRRCPPISWDFTGSASLLVPRSKRRHALFALYCLVLLTVKPIVDIYWQYTGQGRSAAMVLGLVMVPSLR